MSIVHPENTHPGDTHPNDAHTDNVQQSWTRALFWLSSSNNLPFSGYPLIFSIHFDHPTLASFSVISDFIIRFYSVSSVQQIRWSIKNGPFRVAQIIVHRDIQKESASVVFRSFWIRSEQWKGVHSVRNPSSSFNWTLRCIMLLVDWKQGTLFANLALLVTVT